MKKLLTLTVALVALTAVSAKAQYYNDSYYGDQGYQRPSRQGQYQQPSHGRNDAYQNDGYRAPKRRMNNASARRSRSGYRSQNQPMSFYITPRVGVGSTFGWEAEADNPIVPIIGGAFGVKWQNFRAELEADYHFTGELRSESEEDLSIKTNYKQMDFSINGYYDFDLNSPWKPFVGVGLGLSKSTFGVEVKVWGMNGEEDYSETNLTLSAMGGIAYQLTDNVEIEGMARARYVSTDAINLGSGLFNIESLIGLRYTF